MIKIYHNPRCSKSRQTMDLLDSKTANYEVIDYLKNPPSYEEIQSILSKLKIKPGDLIRKGEQVYKDNYKGKDLSDDALIKTMVEHPILIERPIVVKDGRAVLGRPPENIEQLF